MAYDVDVARRMTAMRLAGASYPDIGEKFGVPKERARKEIQRYLRDQRRAGENVPTGQATESEGK